MTFERTEDLALVRAILTEPRCWRRMANDQAPAVEAFQPKLRPGLEYIVARDVGELVALFLLVAVEGGTECHFCFVPRVWGKTAAIARAFVAWVWEETACTRLIGPVPSYNRLALKLAMEVGFTEYGRQPEAVQKGGKSYDRILMSITRPQTAR